MPLRRRRRYFDWDGDTDFAIVIRSATVEDECDRPLTVRPLRFRRGLGPGRVYVERAMMDGVLTALEETKWNRSTWQSALQATRR